MDLKERDPSSTTVLRHVFERLHKAGTLQMTGVPVSLLQVNKMYMCIFNLSGKTTVF